MRPFRPCLTRQNPDPEPEYLAMESAHSPEAMDQSQNPNLHHDIVDPVQDRRQKGNQKSSDEGTFQANSDVMNDPAYDTNGKEKRKGSDEVDTCRICRGEGSEEEPLFYPCKCSGSIKFVHQNCLMEWLSHSQKKHCELCKTPFHFTKLYHPQMPHTVPLLVFLRQAAIHTWKSFLTWSRFQLVMFVWVAWLPWCMRTIWRGLFWIGDGGWVDWRERGIQNQSAVFNLSTQLTAQSPNLTNLNFLVSREATASAFIVRISNSILNLVSPVRWLLTFAAGEPLGLKLLKRLYGFVVSRASGKAPLSTVSMVNRTSHAAFAPRSSSWLSEVKFLRTLTRSTLLNSLIIDSLEGQIITLSLVTAFVLVFLIREWVVQQQPNLFGGAEVRVNFPGAQIAEPPVHQHVDEGHQDPNGDAAVGPADAGLQGQGPRPRIIARPRPRRPGHPRRISEQDTNQRENFVPEGPEREDTVIDNSQSHTDAVDAEPKDQAQGSLQRPSMPDRERLARAAEIRRTIEEQSRVFGVEDDTGKIFQELWHRAGGNPSEVIRIIDDEGRRDELNWIVVAMKKIEKLSVVDGPDRVQVVNTGDGSDTATLSGKDEGSNDSRPSSDDEGFVVLGKLPPNAESESKDGQNMSAEPRREMSEDAAAEAPSSPSRGSQGDLSTLESSSTFSKDQKAGPSNDLLDQPQNRAEGRAIVQDALPEEARHNLDTATSNDAPPRAPGNNAISHNSVQISDIRGRQDEGTPADILGAEGSSGQLPLETLPHTNSPLLGNEGQTQADTIQGDHQRHLGLLERVKDWLWGAAAPVPLPLEQPVGDDEHIVNNIADEAPFIPMERGHPLRAAEDNAEVPGQDPEVVAAAIQAGLDPNEVEAADEIEDIEGIMELVGMQGPLAGLVQNAMFCACLVSLTIFFGVWIPYISGKLFLVFLAHPVSLLFKFPLRFAASTADAIIDVFTFSVACTLYWTDIIIRLICTPVGWVIPPVAIFSQNSSVAGLTKVYAEGALERLMSIVTTTGNFLFESDIPAFSIVAHESLLAFESRATWLLRGMYDYISSCLNIASSSPDIKGTWLLLISGAVNHGKTFLVSVISDALKVLPSLSSVPRFHPLHVNLSMTPRSAPLDYELAYWDTKDRTLAVIFGYLFFAFSGVIYLNVNTWIRGISKTERVAGVLADILYQAGGVLKVILIISIEMIVFPLYCGLLLDVALLPLFGSATLMSRIEFTLSSPYTSVFVHWFVGTCYMFHFALFVAMCRKLMRTGVLCKLSFDIKDGLS